MIRRIIDWSLRFRILLAVAAAVLLFFGVSKLRDMAVDVYPEFGPVVVEVQSEALGLSAQEVAELITVPLEADLLSNIPWVDILRSRSVPSLSSIELVFEPGIDLMRARQVVQERISEAAVALPGASKPPQMLQPRSSMTRVMMIGLTSASQSTIDMSVLARWNIRPRLMGIPGVANVAIWGQREQQLQVLADPAKLEAHRVPLQDVIETTANALWASPLSFVEAAVPGTGGFIDTPNQRIGVQHISPITSSPDLARITLAGRPDLRLDDVASVVEDHQPLIGDAILDKGPGLLLVVEKWPDTSTLEVTRRVEEALAAIAPGLSGIEVDSSIYRPATYIEEAIKNVTVLMTAAAVLLLLVFVGFLFDWRAAVLGAITIPLSLIASTAFVDLVGGTMNLMVLGGLVVAFVLLIDDAVIRAFAIRRSLGERTQGTQGVSTATAIREGLAQAHRPFVYGALIVLLALLPLFFLSGVAGAFFPPMALAYGAAIVASGVLAATLAPAVAGILYPAQPRQHQSSRFALWLRRRYERGLAWVLAEPLPVIGAAAILTLVGVGLLTQVSQPSLLPGVKERNLLVRWDGPFGTSHPEMVRMVSRAANEITAIPGVMGVGSHVGRAITSDHAVGINSGEIWIRFAPDADYEATLAAINTATSGYVARPSLITYPEKRVGEVLTGSSKDVVVRVYGQEYSALRTQAEVVLKALADTEGLVDVTLELPEEEPSVEIQVDLAAAERLGIKPGDVRRSATTLLSGLQVGSLFQEQKVFEVVVWSTPSNRASVNSIRGLIIDTPAGGFVRLGDVADVRIAPKPAVVERESVSRYVDVTANIAGRSVAAVEDEIRAGLKMLSFPIEYHAEVVSDKAAGFRHIRHAVLPYIIAAAVGIFLLLQAAFGSWRLAIVAFATIPAALVGGAFAILLAGGNVSIGSYFGFLALLGISVQNGVALVRGYLSLEKSAAASTLSADLAVLGAAERAGPILVTVLAVSLALLPALFIGNQPGLEVIYPLTVVVLGGLVTTTLIHLFVMPAACLRWWPASSRETLPGFDESALDLMGQGQKP